MDYRKSTATASFSEILHAYKIAYIGNKITLSTTDNTFHYCNKMPKMSGKQTIHGIETVYTVYGMETDSHYVIVYILYM